MAQRDPQEPVYMIGIAAQLTGLHPQTVRLYERLGLVSPRRVNNKNRLYCEADIERLLQIRRFTQEMGVNLAGWGLSSTCLRRSNKCSKDWIVTRKSSAPDRVAPNPPRPPS